MLLIQFDPCLYFGACSPSRLVFMAGGKSKAVVVEEVEVESEKGIRAAVADGADDSELTSLAEGEPSKRERIVAILRKKDRDALKGAMKK